jgi:hypothetical protein
MGILPFALHHYRSLGLTEEIVLHQLIVLAVICILPIVPWH